MTPDELIAAQAGFLRGTDRLGFKLVGALARIFGSLAAKDEETFWFGVTSASGAGFVDLTAVIGNAIPATIQIGQEADFVGTRCLAVAVNPTTGVPITGSLTARMRDNSSDREMMRTPIHIDTLAGTALRSVPFTKNRLFRRNATVTIDFVQLQAVATRLYFIIQGYKIFDEAALDLTRRR